MRAFLGLEVPDASRKVLSGVRTRVDAGASPLPRLRWTPPEQLHLTVRFLGSIEESEAAALLDRLDRSLSSFGPLTVRIDGVSWFPRRRPTVLAASVAPSARLLTLYDLVEREVVAAGHPPESRAPHPHITLARIKRPGSRHLKPIDDGVEIEFVSGQLVFFESKLLPTGASYSHYGEISFGDVPESDRS